MFKEFHNNKVMTVNLNKLLQIITDDCKLQSIFCDTSTKHNSYIEYSHLPQSSANVEFAYFFLNISTFIVFTNVYLGVVS